MRIIFFFFIVLSIASSVNAQLYMPRDINAAFEKGSRSADGKPGPKYWQNHGRYAIQINAAPPARTIYGREQITYVNNSPDTLKVIAIKLILNNHMAGAVRNGQVAEDYLTSGIHIDTFSVNGENKNWRVIPVPVTTQFVRLAKPIPHGDSVHLNFSWHYDMSLQSNREGLIDSTTFYLAYFYPRVAVYDDYNGWDAIEFNDTQEFYNDFNDYTLSVTVPKNYIVWSTGDLMNPAEVLQPTYAKKLQQSLTSDEIIRVATKEDLATGQITAQSNTNTWKWSANNISDMALGFSDHFVWDASSVVVDKTTNRRASVQSAYNDTASDFHYMVGFGRHSLSWFSNNWPGVPYPFSKTTIFQGYADMEYPMMVNDNTTGDTTFTRFVAEHEIAHTWFPFYMGINESRYPFMDEGWATALELLIGRADMGNEKADNFFKRFRVNGWINDKSSDEDLPIITPGDVLKGAGYGNNAYGKPALGYIALKEVLGDDMFKKCLHEYMDRWHGKHPIPWDFFNTFNDVAGNLDWFWKSWFFSNGYIDLAIKDVKVNSKDVAVSIQNKGGFPAPVDIVIKYADGTTETKHMAADAWKQNPALASISIKTTKKIDTIELQGGIFVDADNLDNKWPKLKPY